MSRFVGDGYKGDWDGGTKKFAEKCPWDCIFYPDSDTLYGDCRMPGSDECYLNQKDKEDD